MQLWEQSVSQVCSEATMRGSAPRLQQAFRHITPQLQLDHYVKPSDHNYTIADIVQLIVVTCVWLLINWICYCCLGIEKENICKKIQRFVY